MFKSVFAKYILAFMLIILFCFSLIIAIVASIVANYSVKSKAELVQNSAESASTYFSERLATTEEQETFCEYVASSRGDVEDVLGVIAAASEDMTVIITDKSGALLLSAGKDSATLPPTQGSPAR